MASFVFSTLIIILYNIIRDMHSYSSMIFIMILSGLLSSMYIWSDKLSDIRISLNDFYMIFLMTSYMIFFMAIQSNDINYIFISFICILLVLYAIRNQIFVTKEQYFMGMIPHHSMLVFTSKKVLKNEKNLSKKEKEFVEDIIRTQEQEIQWIKNLKS